MLRTIHKLHTNSGRTLALAITAVISLSAFGQDRLWLNTGNAAGLATYTTDGRDTLSHYIPSTNKTWLGAGVSMGKFHSVDEGKTEYQMGAGAQAAYRLNRQTVLAGGVSYIHGEKRNAAGSVWFRPQEAPFNITETSDSTRGNKNSDTYNIWGALSYNVSNAFTLGVGADFTAANYAKQKDPRQKDNYLDFTISPGFMWRLGGGFALGLNYTYRRTMENMTFRLAGRQDKVYEYLIDRGAYFGRTETTDETGYTDDSFEKPLLDESHGAGLQLEIDFGRATWLNQLDYYHRHGHYGEESQAQIHFSRHSGDGFNYDSWLEFHGRQKDMIHGLQLHVDYEKVTPVSVSTARKHPNRASPTSIIMAAVSQDDGRKALSGLAISTTRRARSVAMTCSVTSRRHGVSSPMQAIPTATLQLRSIRSTASRSSTTSESVPVRSTSVR